MVWQIGHIAEWTDILDSIAMNEPQLLQLQRVSAGVFSTRVFNGLEAMTRILSADTWPTQQATNQ